MSMDATQTMTECENKMMSSEEIQFRAVACCHGQTCEEQAIKNTRKRQHKEQNLGIYPALI